ncbi:MAG: T9SS type A sorting domain-containing protein [Bacteroidetes bacterium]|nr:T9SS type A sorting domain-containing protein [Bacteroidota bacterium]
MKRITLFVLLALPTIGWTQGKFYGGNAQGWAMEILLNQSLAVGVLAPQPQTELAIHPNPVVSQLVVDHLAAESAYLIFDVLGKEIWRGMVISGQPIDVSLLLPGFYTLQVGNQSRKFLKE